MISIINMNYYIGSRALYEDASVVIKSNDKIGLIGLNGQGKSTLLKIIHGDLRVSQGQFSKANNCDVGFLNQDMMSFQSDDSICMVAMGAFEQALHTQREIDTLLQKLEKKYTQRDIEKLTELQEKYADLDGYVIQSKTEEVLLGVGFSTADLSRPLRQFSGGWRMRVMLAKLLLQSPACLLLDEPTNHLDLPSIEWVEKYLSNYQGAVVVVSHDRQFLDNVVTKTVEVTQKRLITYEGNYSFYLKEKKLREQIQQNSFENQQKKIRQTERFIERFRAKSTKARQVQARIKTLDRMERVEEVVTKVESINFKFTFEQQSGRHVAVLNQMSKSYGHLDVLKNTHATIERGDKIALIGANGKGKSTLLRILANTENPTSGECKMGYNVIFGFYAQHQLESLQVENDVITELKQVNSAKSEQELRNLLGCFLFSGDDIFKRIKILSGGEKSRVALAKTLVSGANFLLLDEPTNHLDFISETLLIQALQHYRGSFVLVSHNRHFIRQVATKIWYIEDGQVKEYPGTYDEYVWSKQRSSNPKAEEVTSKKSKKKKQHKKLPSGRV